MNNKDAFCGCARVNNKDTESGCARVNNNEKRRSFWICFIFTFIFFILGVSTLTCHHHVSNNVSFLFGLWLLQLMLLLFFAYYALLCQPCHVMIYILFFITLLFATMWLLALKNNLVVSNLSLVVALIFTLTLIYLTPSHFQILGIVSVLIWLFLFFYVNTIIDQNIAKRLDC